MAPVVNKPIPLSDFTGGINTFEKECAPNQAVDASDVWERDGDVQRRPGFKTVVAGPVHFLPHGALMVKREAPNGTITDVSDRNLNSLQITSDVLERIWFGCTEPFDGIDIPISSVSGLVGEERNLAVKYRNSDEELVVAYDITDTTVGDSSTLTSRRLPLRKAGRVSWHQSQFEDWEATELDGDTAYWVCIELAERPLVGGEAEPAYSFYASATSRTLGMSAPGCRAFTLAPINGLFSARLKNETPVLFVGADRVPTDRELGGNIGVRKNHSDSIKESFIVDRSGSAVIQQATTPAWSHAGASTGTEGTSSVVTKLDQTYNMFTNEQAGSKINGAAIPVSVVTSAAVFRLNLSGLGIRKPFKGNIIEVAAAGGVGGLSIGDRFEVVSCALDLSNDVADVVIYPVPAGMNTSVTFNLWSQANTLVLRDIGNTPFKDRLLQANAAHTFTPLAIGVINPSLPSAQYTSFQTGKYAVHAIPPGKFWSFCFNAVTGRIIFTNGQSALLEYDGEQTRKLPALWNATDGVEGADKVAVITAGLETLALELGNPDINQGNVLRRQPPDVSLVAYYRGLIVVVHRHDPTVIYWTAPGAANDIWPVIYATSVRDQHSAPITGLFTLNEQLIAVTSNGLFAANPPGIDNYLIFTPVAQGIGFLGQNSVATIALAGSSVLVGPNTDGISAFTGASPISLLDDWRRVVDGGINTRVLDKSCGAVWQQENLYFLSVASKGSSVNDLVIVVDYSPMQGGEPCKLWVWRPPYGGVTSMCTDRDNNGKERVLFGMADGHVCELADIPRDGAEEIVGRAKSPPIYFEGRTMAFTGAHVMIEELGTEAEVTVRTFVNSDRNRQTLVKQVRSGGEVFDTARCTTTGVSDEFSDPRQVTRKLNFRAGGVDASGALERATIGESFQYEIESSARFKLRAAQLHVSPKGLRGK